MEGSLPTPAMRLFRGETGIFMPTFVEELVRTVRQIAPRECRDGINHLPKFGLRLLDLVKRISEGFLRPLAFNCDASDVPGSLDQFKISTVGGPWLRMGDAESAENFS